MRIKSERFKCYECKKEKLEVINSFMINSEPGIRNKIELCDDCLNGYFSEYFNHTYIPNLKNIVKRLTNNR